MICLCCGKELNDSTNVCHKKCIIKFFYRDDMPDIKIKLDEKEIINNIKVFTPGVQEKLSIHIGKHSDKKVSYYDDDSRYIVQLENNYKEITVAEHVTMLMAEAYKIRTCEHGLIKNDDSYIYIAKRYDRDLKKKIHVEDLCQLSNKLTEDKYKGSYEKVGNLINHYSFFSKLDLIEFFRIILFSYVTLNNDMHLKNFSLIEDESIRLSPAYDLLPTKLFVDDGSDLALTLNGKDRNITKNDVIKFGQYLEINDKAINKMLTELYNSKETFIDIINNSVLSNGFKENYIEKMCKKIELIK